MRLSQARGSCADLLYRDYEPALCIEAQRKLVADLVVSSPRVSGGDIGEIFLDAEGLAYTGGEGKFCRDLLRLVSAGGYTESVVGIADSAFAAALASRVTRRRWLMIPRGEERLFMAGLPPGLLPLCEESKETLRLLGIKTIGAYLDLTLDQIRHKFGVEGERAYNLACGLDQFRPMLPLIEKNFQCILDLGGPMESLTDTIFVMKSLIERLVTELVAAGLCAEEMTVSFFSDDFLFEERPIRLVKPSNHAKFLLEVLRLSLEATPLAREFTAVKLVISRTTAESFEQIDLAVPDSNLDADQDQIINRSAFAYLLQRMETRLGEGAIVHPVAEDQYFPELAGLWQPLDLRQSIREPVEDAGSEYALKILDGKGLASGLVLKRFPRPEPALVELDGPEPVSITFDNRWYRVMKVTSAERLSGLWWEEPVRKSYYMAMVKPAGLETNVEMIMLTLNHLNRMWAVEGIYD